MTAVILDAMEINDAVLGDFACHLVPVRAEVQAIVLILVADIPQVRAHPSPLKCSNARATLTAAILDVMETKGAALGACACPLAPALAEMQHYVP
jgi:hypothetical protein